ncbi:hypothetical protein D3C87_1912910 [compost metagenome]
MSDLVLMYLQEWAFEFGECQPDRIYLRVRNTIAARHFFPGHHLGFTKGFAFHDIHVERCERFRISGYQVDVSQFHDG